MRRSEEVDVVWSLTVTYHCCTETSGAETPVPKYPSAEKSQRRNGQCRDGGTETVAPKCHIPSIASLTSAQNHEQKPNERCKNKESDQCKKSPEVDTRILYCCKMMRCIAAKFFMFSDLLWCSELFGEVGVGINFDKYEDIPVEATGEGCPMHIDNVSRISLSLVHSNGCPVHIDNMSRISLSLVRSNVCLMHIDNVSPNLS